METESLKSLGWLLLWGGFFYFMMRHGCGAHMMGGHGGHGSHGQDPHGEEKTGGDVKDPVCGMAVDPRSAAAAAVRGGSTHYFCSSSCRDKFEQAPERFGGPPASAGSSPGGHHHE